MVLSDHPKPALRPAAPLCPHRVPQLIACLPFTYEAPCVDQYFDRMCYLLEADIKLCFQHIVIYSFRVFMTQTLVNLKL